MIRVNKIVESVFRRFNPNTKSVDFIICGTQKGGTTALDIYLREHLEICMAARKEVHFFDNEDNFANGNPDYSEYHRFFKPKKTHKLLGESTPVYMYWNESPKRIFEYNPKMKLIIILRNPIERAYSHWNMERSRGADSLSFSEAVSSEEERCRAALPYQHRLFSYIDRGHYIDQLRTIWKYFPKQNVLVLRNEDLKQHPKDTLNKVADFLEVAHFNDIENKDIHSRPYVSQIDVKERTFLKSIFEAGIRELEAELQWDCSDWLE
ncbi:sulfotransferase domain-containing protein [Agarivorans aestuarii]|uniref:sulfotransferase domain-containing protein n=1 Tax=Agarivorans aestuarii TaxID=1563703 RepID=UPI001C80959A|nr:sulfotransferase domain-containing protein [Agarivorans aestuarii]